jgi:pectin methylesterase-like acyl-CoA thioesterase
MRFKQIAYLFMAVCGLVVIYPLEAEEQAATVTACTVLEAHLTAKSALVAPGGADTARIQQALSACAPGKAVVLASNGARTAFLAAPLVIPRGVTLFVDKAVTLYASRNPRDYDLAPKSCGAIEKPYVEGEQPACKPFLFSYQATNSGIAGEGTIDGQGAAWWKLNAAHRIAAPDLVSDYESQNFSVAGVHLRNAARWSLSIYKTPSPRVNGVTVDAPAAASGVSGVLLSNSPDAELTAIMTHVPGAGLDLRASILGGTKNVKVDHLHVVGGAGLSLGDPVYGDVAKIQIAHALIENAAFTFDLQGTKGGKLHDVRIADSCVAGAPVPLASLPADRAITLENVTGVTAPVASCPAPQWSAAPQWTIDRAHLDQPGTRAKLTVAADGSGDYRTVAEAVAVLPATGGEIAVKPGTYREVVTIRKPHVHLYGLGDDPAKTVIVFDNTSPKNGGTFNSATVFVEADDVTIDHLTISNDSGNHGQAVALAITADRGLFSHLRVLGAQDTLFAAARYCYGDYGPCVPTRQYFKDCYIAGNVDFTFGDSKAVFDECELHGIAGKNIMYTAHGQHYAAQQSGYVFNRCKLTADPAAQNINLGRPWRPYATIVWLNTEMDAPIVPEGWSEWMRFGKSSLATAFYAEYQSTGKGASATPREPHAHALTAAEAERWSTAQFLAGDDHWNPATSVR